MCACRGWCARFPRSCLPLSPTAPPPYACLCWMVCLPSRGLVFQLVSLLVSLCGGWFHFACSPDSILLARGFSCFVILMWVTLFLETCLESTHCLGSTVVQLRNIEFHVFYRAQFQRCLTHVGQFRCSYIQNSAIWANLADSMRHAETCTLIAISVFLGFDGGSCATMKIPWQIPLHRTKLHMLSPTCI